jgi:hypothetical protein
MEPRRSFYFRRRFFCGDIVQDLSFRFVSANGKKEIRDLTRMTDVAQVALDSVE